MPMLIARRYAAMMLTFHFDVRCHIAAMHAIAAPYVTPPPIFSPYAADTPPCAMLRRCSPRADSATMFRCRRDFLMRRYFRRAYCAFAISFYAFATTLYAALIIDIRCFSPRRLRAAALAPVYAADTLMSAPPITPRADFRAADADAFTMLLLRLLLDAAFSPARYASYACAMSCRCYAAMMLPLPLSLMLTL